MFRQLYGPGLVVRTVKLTTLGHGSDRLALTCCFARFCADACCSGWCGQFGADVVQNRVGIARLPWRDSCTRAVQRLTSHISISSGRVWAVVAQVLSNSL